MARIAIIVGHPRTDTFCEALAESYAQGAEAAHHEVSLFIAGRMHFDPILRMGYERVQPLEPDLVAAYEAIMAADHLVFIFPLWIGTLPAIFKGFLERVLQPDLVAATRERKFPHLLKGKSARIILTMGMPRFVYRWWFGAHALRMLRRNILCFLGARPIRSLVCGNVEGVGPAGRRRWLHEVEELGRRAA